MPHFCPKMSFDIKVGQKEKISKFQKAIVNNINYFFKQKAFSFEKQLILKKVFDTLCIKHF